MYKRFPKPLLLLFGIVGIACQPNASKINSTALQIDTNSYAELFQLSYQGHDTLLHIFNLSKQTTLRYFWGKSDHIEAHQKLTRPKRIVTSSAIFARMLHELNESQQIIGVDNLSYYPRDLNLPVSIPSLQVGGNLHHENLIKLRPDLVLTYYLQDADRQQWKRYQKSNIQVVFLQSHQEKHPLGRAEWIRPLAHLLGKPTLGDSLFKQIKWQYEQSRKSASPGKKKTMLNLPFEGIWYIPPGDSYTDQLLLDAGHLPAWERQKTQVSTRIISMEEAVKYLKNSHLWLNLGSVKNTAEIITQEPRLKDFVRSKHLRMFQPDKLLEKNGANAFWDLGAVRPELILNDLIQIQRESSLDSLIFYRELK